MGENSQDAYEDDIPHLKDGQNLEVKARRIDRTEVKISLKNICELGTGAFGVVNKMVVQEDNNPKKVRNCAVKIPGAAGVLAKIELYLLLKLQHENVVKLLYYFIPKELTENIVIVLELVDGGDLFRYMKNLSSYGSSPVDSMGVLFEVFSYQLFRGLAYCHGRKVCHRDIKPENLLVNPITGILKIADFGCGAEMVSKNESHTFYIGTRIFRAPELLLGADIYDFKVDVWSAAIVLSEMILGVPIFYASEGLEALLIIMFEHLGIPTEKELGDMKIVDVAMPPRLDRKYSIEERVQRCEPRNEEEIIFLLKAMLVYSPQKRMSAWEVCASDFFRPLRGLKELPNGNPSPRFFNFSQQEIQYMPPHVKKKLRIKPT